MSRTLLLLAASVALFSGSATFANAADIIDPPVVELPEPMAPVASSNGGWYLRGDVGYTGNGNVNATYDVFTAPNGPFSKGLLEGKLRSGYSIGGGIGYDTGNYLRVDLTADYFSKTNFTGTSAKLQCPTLNGCTDDSTTMTALSLMSTLYVDVVKVEKTTFYAGVGLGGTQVKWDKLTNVCRPGVPFCVTDTHPGETSLRFTYDLVAGASYDVSDCVAVDAGYRYRKIEGGKMFGIASLGNPGGGHDKGIASHDFRIGARYKLGNHNSGGCGGAKVVDYQPDYQPVYK